MTITQTVFTDIADAIREKDGSTELMKISEMAERIRAIPEGGGGEPSGDVEFIDYDGTKLYAYSKEEFLALTEMPQNPQHEGLTSQGWNWTLSDAKSHVRNSDLLVIGQLYTTVDNAVHLYIEFEEGSSQLSPVLYVGVGNGYINWGDGKRDYTYSSSVTGYKHTYSSPGKYEIVISRDYSEGDIVFGGGSSTMVFKEESGTYSGDTYAYILKSVRLCDNVQLKTYAFAYMKGLLDITIPSSVNLWSDNSFKECESLKGLVCYSDSSKNGVYLEYIATGCRAVRYISLPYKVYSLNANYSFQSCTSLQKMTFSEKVGYLPKSCFTYCYALKEVALSPSIRTLGDGCFGACYVLERVINLGYVTYGGTSTPFNSCYSLKEADMSSMQDTYTRLFSGAYSLKKVTISSYNMTMLYNTFSEIYSLREVVIPKNITSLSGNVFSGCHNLQYADFSKHTSVPSVSTTAFQYYPKYLEIIVPDNLYDSWVTATNWTTYAANIVKKSESTKYKVSA